MAKVVGAEVNDEIARKIEELAKYNQCSKSAIVRKALIIGLKKIEEQTQEILQFMQISP
jgi:predicted transcriptional regulator